jgi:hypothetical protein
MILKFRLLPSSEYEFQIILRIKWLLPYRLQDSVVDICGELNQFAKWGTIWTLYRPVIWKKLRRQKR